MAAGAGRAFGEDAPAAGRGRAARRRSRPPGRRPRGGRRGGRRACGSGRRAIGSRRLSPSSSLETNAQPVAPASTKMSSQLTWLATSRLCGRDAARRRCGRRRRRSARSRRGTAAARAIAGATARCDSRCGTQAIADPAEQGGGARARPASCEELGLAAAVEGDAVQLHAMVDEAEAELLGDALLQFLEVLVDELDDLAGLDVDQMVVVGVRRRFIARAAVAELVALEDAGFLEQADGAVDGGDGDLRDRSPRRARAASRRRDGPRPRTGCGRWSGAAR